MIQGSWTRGVFLIALMTAAFVVQDPNADGGGLEVLRVGDVLERELRLDPDEGYPVDVFMLTVDQSGPIHITLDSIAFTPKLVLETLDRIPVESAERAGIADNLVLVHEARPGSLRVVVSSKGKAMGPYLLAVRDGIVQEQAETDRLHDAAQHYLKRAKFCTSEGKMPEAALAHWHAARRFLTLGDRRSAMDSLIATAELTDRETQIGNRLWATAMAYRAFLLHQSGSLEIALELFEQARLAADDLNELSIRAYVLEGLCRVHMDLGNDEEAGNVVTEFGELEGNKKPAREALARSLMAQLAERRFDLLAANKLFTEAVDLARAQPDQKTRSLVLQEAGRFWEERGEFDRAIELFEEVVHNKPSWSMHAIASSRIALIRMEQQEPSSARIALDGILEEARQHGHSGLEDGVLISLAQVARRLGDTDEAHSILSGVLDRMDPDAHWARRFDVQLDIADVLHARGDLAEAQLLYEEALELCREEKDARRETWVRINLGAVLIDLGEHEAAVPHHERAFQLSRKMNARRLKAAALDGLAASDLALGQVDQAARRANDAVEILHSQNAYDLALFPTLTLARAALRHNDIETVDKLVAEARRVLSGRVVHSLSRKDVSRLRSRFHDWARVTQDAIAARILASATEDRDSILERGFRAAQDWKGRALLEGVRGNTPPSGRLTAAPATSLVGQLSDALAGSRMLIEFVEGDDHLYAYRIWRGNLTLHDLGAHEMLFSEVDRFVAATSDLNHVNHPESLSQISESGALLHSRLLAPLLADGDEDLAGLAIIPSTRLGRLPFDALVMRTDGATSNLTSFDQITYVADQLDVTYAPSSAVLAELLRMPPRRFGERFLLIGDPEDPSHTKLRHARGELGDLARLLLKRDPDSSESDFRRVSELTDGFNPPPGIHHAGPFDLIVGTDCNLANLGNVRGPHHVIHLVAHGEVDLEDPSRTGVYLTPDTDEPGVLDLDRVRELGMQADLVTLSACHTARGRVLKGEGTQSLVYSFLESGSGAVVASLWAVNDEKTRAAMQMFYSLHLESNLPVATALRRSRNALRRDGFRGRSPYANTQQDISPEGHPYFWAPLIFVGDWRGL